MSGFRKMPRPGVMSVAQATVCYLIHMGTMTVGSDGGTFYSLNGQLFPPHGSYLVPNARDIGLEQAEESLGHLEDAAQQLKQHLAVWPDEHRDEFTYLFTNASLDRQREIAGLLTGAQQSANLVLAAMCEAHGLVGADTCDGSTRIGKNPPRAWDLLRAGFVLEGVGQYLVSIGHNMANIGLRCALEASSIRSRIDTMDSRNRDILKAASRPNTKKPAAWIFHSQAPTLLRAIGGHSNAIRPLRVAATLYRAQDWQPMVGGRNVSFHRIREEFPASPEASTNSILTLYRQNQRALQVLGRALPSFILGLRGASPKAARGRNRGTPLLGPVYVRRMGETDSRLAIPYARFQG